MRCLVGLIRNGRYLTGDEIPPPEPRRMAPQIMVDRAPVVSPIDGSVIGSRRDVREHEKKHGVVEVGTDQSMLRPKAPYQPTGVKADIKDAMERVRAGKVEQPDLAPDPIDQLFQGESHGR